MHEVAEGRSGVGCREGTFFLWMEEGWEIFADTAHIEDSGIEDSGLGSARALKISDQETAPLRLAGHLDSDKRAALGRAFNKASGKSSVAQDVKNDVQSAKLARKPVGGERWASETAHLKEQEDAAHGMGCSREEFKGLTSI